MSFPNGFNSYLDWTFDDSVSSALNLGGGQLRDKDNRCLSYFPENFGSEDTRIQVGPCLDANASAEDLEKQLWSIELGESSSELYYIRNVCTDLVIRKIKPDCSDNHPLISGYCKCNFHFDADLVPRNKCVDSNKFGVNDCLFDVDGDLATI